MNQETEEWLRAKHEHDRQQPMGQFFVLDKDLLLTLSWPIYGGYGGYSCRIKKLR